MLRQILQLLCYPSSRQLDMLQVPPPTPLTPKTPTPKRRAIASSMGVSPSPGRRMLGTPARARPCVSPSPTPARFNPPALRLVEATPAKPLSPPPGGDPARLSLQWAPKPRTGPTIRLVTRNPEAEQPTRSKITDSPHAGLLEDLYYIAGTDLRSLVDLPTYELLSVIDDLVEVLPDEDMKAAESLLYAQKEGDDLDDRSREELHRLCGMLARDLLIVDGVLRLFTDESTF